MCRARHWRICCATVALPRRSRKHAALRKKQSLPAAACAMHPFHAVSGACKARQICFRRIQLDRIPLSGPVAHRAPRGVHEAPECMAGFGNPIWREAGDAPGGAVACTGTIASLCNGDTATIANPSRHARSSNVATSAHPRREKRGYRCDVHMLTFVLTALDPNDQSGPRDGGAVRADRLQRAGSQQRGARLPSV